jgi:hypothetical protein
MQHSISQTSGSQKASESGAESQPIASANAATAARTLSRVFRLMVIDERFFLDLTLIFAS